MLERAHKKLRWLRRLSVVPRWTVVPTIQRQNVAEHTFHVVCTARWLVSVCAEATGKHYTDGQMLRLIDLCLDHDADEAAKGDAPSPSKGMKRYEGINEMEAFVKVCDVLEAYAFITEDIQMGNKRVGAILLDLTDRMSDIWPHFTWMGEKPPFTFSHLLGMYTNELGREHPGLELPL